MTNYRTIKESTEERLDRTVNNYIKAGWRCSGSAYSHDGFVLQPMETGGAPETTSAGHRRREP